MIPLFRSSRIGKWLALGALALSMPHLNAVAVPVMQSDGMIVEGDFRVSLNKEAVIHISDPEGLVYDLFFPMSYPDNDSGQARKAVLKDPKLTVDEKSRTRTYTAMAQPPNGRPFPVEVSIAITPEGRIRVTAKGVLEGPIDPFLTFRGDLHVPREGFVGGVIQVGGNKCPIPDEKPSTEGKTLKRGAPETVLFNAGDPHRQITLIPVSQSFLSITDQNKVSYRGPFISMVMEKQGNALVYDVELPNQPTVPKSPDTYAGIDFWKNNRLHMPQFGQSRNLIQNPGFEAGFAYWHWASLGRFTEPPKYDEYSSITGEQAHGGKRSLALRGQKGASAAQVATFAIPVEKDQEYTWSFYARSSNATGRLGLNAQGFFTPPFMVWKTIEVTGPEWKRYTFTFKTTHSILNVSVGNGSQEDDVVYVDDMQLEKGNQATEFTTKPVLAWLASDFRGNFWEPGADPKAVLRVSGKPGVAGKAAIKESDFFGAETDRGAVEFKLDENGEATVPLPWAAKLPPGTHVINLDLSTRDGFNGKDTGRFTVMRFLKNEHRNKNLFSGHLRDATGSWKRQAEFFKRVGLGSTILFDPCSHEFHKILEDNGILHFSSIFDGGQGFKQAMNWDQHKNGFDLTPEQLSQIEELCYQKAKAYPEVKYWKLNNEPDVGPFIDNLPNMNKMVDALIAARKGTLRGNPDAVLIGSDPANMYASSGIAFVNTQLEAIGDRKVYDIPAIHPYRERPEAPDRDAETKLFLSMLDRHGYHGDVWFTEGIYHQNYIVPEWSLNTHKACSTDHFRGGALSYDMGWGERMNAAYAARSWLTSLKYGDRVKLDIDWGFYVNSSLDVDLTPGAISFATNTLGRILGNAVFKTDLGLGYEVRCYVFEDEQERPIAAIWYHNIESDKGKVLGPVLDVSALAGAKLTYADFMGNLRKLKPAVQLGPFPIFIRGAKGSLDAFVGQLSQASLIDDKGALFASISVQSPTQAVIQVENSINKPFKGTARLYQGREAVAEEKISIAAKKSWSHVIDASTGPNRLTATDLTLQLIPEGKAEPVLFELKQSVMAWPKRKAPITFSGNLAEWETAFHLPVSNAIEFAPYGVSPEKRRMYKENPVAWRGEADLSATMYGTWDEENLYLAFAVKDDVLHPNARPENAWNGDSLQLYFDGWADARKHREKGYGPDDQTFSIWPNPAGSVIRRDVTPERQLAFLDAGPVKNARLKVTRTEGVTLYEIALPLKDLYPLQLKAGEKFGFAPMVNDDDGDYRKRAFTLTPQGTEPSNRPDLLPTVILAP